jgi:hypothetical protein
MGSDELRNLTDIGQLKSEPFSRTEFLGLLESGKARLQDAAREDLNPTSRFDLAYNAAHALALAALRICGYRTDRRFLVFQCLRHTLDLPNESWRVLDSAHRKRNLAEYEGHVDLEDQLTLAVIRVAEEILDRLERLEAERAPPNDS